jgi:histidine triad (HIT) family protein
MSAESCVFCKIVAGTLPADIILDTEDLLVIKDINPQAPIHYLILPKKHIETLLDLNPMDTLLASELLMITQRLANKAGIKSFRLVANNGKEANQRVPHLHLHFVAGSKMTGF